jgi:hypothetical protein
MTYSAYGYADGSPLNGIDPTGLSPIAFSSSPFSGVDPWGIGKWTLSHGADLATKVGLGLFRQCEEKEVATNFPWLTRYVRSPVFPSWARSAGGAGIGQFIKDELNGGHGAAEEAGRVTLAAGAAAGATQAAIELCGGLGLETEGLSCVPVAGIAVGFVANKAASWISNNVFGWGDL